MELTPGPGRSFNPDAWDGYAANRDRIVRGLVDSPVRNAVVLTGDVHSHWAAEVHERFDDPSSLLTAGVPIYTPDHMAGLHTHYLAVPDVTAKSFHDRL